jgi:hypothetical protein
MNPLPSCPNHKSVFLEERLYTAKPDQRESLILTPANRPAVAVHLENRFPSICHHMNVSRAMVVRIDHDPQTGKSKDCRHCGL